MAPAPPSPSPSPTASPSTSSTSPSASASLPSASALPSPPSPIDTSADETEVDDHVHIDINAHLRSPVAAKIGPRAPLPLVRSVTPMHVSAPHSSSSEEDAEDAANNTPRLLVSSSSSSSAAPTSSDNNNSTSGATTTGTTAGTHGSSNFLDPQSAYQHKRRYSSSHTEVKQVMAFWKTLEKTSIETNVKESARRPASVAAASSASSAASAAAPAGHRSVASASVNLSPERAQPSTTKPPAAATERVFSSSSTASSSSSTATAKAAPAATVAPTSAKPASTTTTTTTTPAPSTATATAIATATATATAPTSTRVPPPSAAPSDSASAKPNLRFPSAVFSAVVASSINSMGAGSATGPGYTVAANSSLSDLSAASHGSMSSIDSTFHFEPGVGSDLSNSHRSSISSIASASGPTSARTHHTAAGASTAGATGSTSGRAPPALPTSLSIISPAASPRAVDADAAESEAETETETEAEPEPEPEPEPEQLDPEKLARHREQRKRVRAEINGTEQSYVKALETLVTEFVHPLKSTADFGVPQHDVSAIFSNVELLYNFHRVFLADLLAAHSTTDDEPPPVAAIFMRCADFLKMYTVYLNGYTASLSVITSHRKNSKFQDLLSEKRKKCGLDLMSYLIMPVQRIPRYEMLLRELLRYTPRDDAEHAKLSEAFAKIQKIAAHVNESRRAVENMSKLVEIQHTMSGDFGDLLQPHRRLVREGVVQKVTGGLLSSSAHPRHLYVFSDILLWTTTNGKFRGHTRLSTLTVKEFSDKGKIGFQLLTDDRSKDLIFLCASEKERSEWIDDIAEASRASAAQVDRIRARQANASISFVDTSSLEEGTPRQQHHRPQMSHMMSTSSRGSIFSSGLSLSPRSTTSQSQLMSSSSGYLPRSPSIVPDAAADASGNDSVPSPTSRTQRASISSARPPPIPAEYRVMSPQSSSS